MAKVEIFAKHHGGEVVSMSIADAFSDVPVASPATMANSELMETNVVNDEVENGMQDDCVYTDDSGCLSSSGSGDTVQDCTLTS